MLKYAILNNKLIKFEKITNNIIHTYNCRYKDYNKWWEDVIIKTEFKNYYKIVKLNCILTKL